MQLFFSFFDSPSSFRLGNDDAFTGKLINLTIQNRLHRAVKSKLQVKLLSVTIIIFFKMFKKMFDNMPVLPFLFVVGYMRHI